MFHLEACDEGVQAWKAVETSSALLKRVKYQGRKLMCHVVFSAFRRQEQSHGAGRRTSIRRIGVEALGTYSISRAPDGGLGPKLGSCSADVLDCGVRKSGSGLCGASVCRIPHSVRRTCPHGRCSSPPLHHPRLARCRFHRRLQLPRAGHPGVLWQAKRIVCVPHLIQ